MDREHRRYKPGHRLPALSPQQDDGLVLEVRHVHAAWGITQRVVAGSRCMPLHASMLE